MGLLFLAALVSMALAIRDAIRGKSMLLRALIFAPLFALYSAARRGYGLWGWVCRSAARCGYKADRGMSWVIASRRNTVLFLVISLLTTRTVVEVVEAVAALAAPMVTSGVVL